mmetsp:Transcript_403/g.849  ORF Transcript_403/g.849 Transcript_403/m.849 type:complete len:455 (-) Transcript_403:300-1664(-)|eukprot:CAMPEP_0197284548 /NCGR_PEP_ID=MMETSP1432-20130617/25499_1 /TAXON_ID=44447 /ORGANISM="Pseudo-nitzschia delicatissima, Strain UNC1205" /LENGTH=454 /DNA_ID=CAMNT_0042751563 /DNA_START=249 /DNA_END=1613 /DNA_ORIENTATION=+
MAGSDVNDKLNGLISLLKTVGIDGLDSNALLEQQKLKSSPKKESSSDAQILELVKKLQQAQADSPEILEALKSPELLVLASLAAQKQSAAPEPPKPAPTSLDDVFDVDDDNYPKIGPGYSDDISVVSELSCPTVMTRQSVAEEEYYNEVNAKSNHTPPPLLSRGLAGNGLRGPVRNIPNRVAATAKSRNMVGQVRPIAPRRSIPTIPVKPSGGAAAQRRLNYQMAMNKLEETGFGSPRADKPEPLSPIQSVGSKESKKLSRTVSGTKSIGSNARGGGGKSIGSNTAGSGSRRKPRSQTSKSKTTDDVDWGTTDDDGWPAFEELKNSNSASELFVDSDGFFTDDVFANDDHGVTTSKSRRKKRTDESTSSGGKKKSSREERSRKHRSRKDKDGAVSDDDKEGSTRKSHRTKKERERDNASDDGTGTSRKSKSKKDKDKDREKATRRKARRATMQT